MFGSRLVNILSFRLLHIVAPIVGAGFARLLISLKGGRYKEYDEHALAIYCTRFTNSRIGGGASAWHK